MNPDVLEQTPKTQTRPGQQSGATQQQPDKAEMMRKMEAAGAPGAPHKAFQALAGNWKAEVKCWMDPSAPPEVTQATAKGNLIFGGRFFEEEFHGQMMGKPFTGKTLMGYDNAKQTFNSVWCCDTQTSIFVSEGKADSANKTLSLEGKVTCAATGRRDMPMKTVLKIISPDKHTFEMFDGASNMKTLEITYTRQ